MITARCLAGQTEAAPLFLMKISNSRSAKHFAFSIEIGRRIEH